MSVNFPLNTKPSYYCNSISSKTKTSSGNLNTKNSIGISFEASQTLKSMILPNISFGLNDEEIIKNAIINKLNDCLPEFGILTKDFYRGKCPDDHSLKLLSQLGVNTMIDFRLPEEIEKFDYQQKCAKQYNMDYISVPTPSTTELATQIYEKNYQPLKDNFMKFLISTKLAKKPFFMHCEAGQLRTSLYEVLYKIYFLNVDTDKAIEESNKYCVSRPEEIQFSPIKAIITKFQKDNPNFTDELAAKLNEYMITKQDE